jgi:hypothetical protein
MQGKTGEFYFDNNNAKKTMLDPGAMRSTFAYIKTFNSNINPNNNDVKDAINGGGDDNNGSWYKDYGQSLTDNTEVQPGTYYISYDTGPSNPSKPDTKMDAFSGTTTFVTSTDFELDRLQVNLNNIVGVASLQPTYVVTKADKAELDPQYQGKKIGNNFLLTLYKFFERPENIDLLRFDMFKDVYVVGTSSLPTGSQMQGSISLNWDSQNGFIKIKQERFAAFYHS